MRVLLLPVLIWLLPHLVCAQAPPAVSRDTFALLLTLNPAYQDDAAWTPAVNQAVGQHWQAIQALHQAGRVLFVGRTMEKASAGIVVFTATDAQAADAVLQADAAVRAGIMTGRIVPYAAVLVGKP